jgi:hypothetical protein
MFCGSSWHQTNFAPFSGAIQSAGASGCIYSNCRALYNSYNGGLDFQPRIGFAYNPEAFNRRFSVTATEARAAGIPEPPDPSRYTSVQDPTQPFRFRFPGMDGNIVADTDPLSPTTSPATLSLAADAGRTA